VLTGLLIFFALAIGIYPAMVLGQATIARPLWEPLLLIPLFLLLGLHSGFALVQLLTSSRWTDESLEQIRKLDLIAIGIQIVLFALLVIFTSFSSAGKEQVFYGDFALWFWGGVVFIGWVLPFIVSSSSVRSKNALIVTQLCFIIGSFSLRTVIVFNGQGAHAFIGT
jgi:formate-dependent nitrite reductase membrane component NrfD